MILQIGEVVTTIPTIGFNVESVVYKNLNFNVWVSAPSMPLPNAKLNISYTGLGRSDIDTALLEVLLCKHGCRHLRR